MPPLRIRLLGRTLSFIASRAPWLWPLVKRPVQRFWNRSAASWDTGRTSPDRTRAFSDALDHVGRPKRIVEIGTGTGSGAEILVERFPDAEVVGVDLSPAMVELARAKVPAARFEAADASALPFHDASIDLVAQNNVPVYFKELARVVAPGGHVLITSTFGPATPYYTPHSVLRRRFEKLGFTEIRSERAPPGDWFRARRP